MKLFKILIVVFATGITFFSCQKDDEYTSEEEIKLRKEYMNSLNSKGIDIETTQNGLSYFIEKNGEGELAKTKDTLVVKYRGTFIDEKLFDSSEFHSENGTFKFVLDTNPMIKGWEEGLKLMNKGAKFHFIIPSELAYGSEWYYNIPPYSTLLFDIELCDIISPKDK